MTKRHTNNIMLLLSVIFITSSAFTAHGEMTASIAGNTSKAGAAKVVARVNGTEILQSELDIQITKSLAKTSKFRMGQNPKVREDRLRREILEQIISDELLRQASKNYSVADLDKKVTDKIAAMQQRYSSEEEFASVLKDMQLTMKDMREKFREQILREEYLANITSTGQTPSDDEMAKYYQANQNMFKNRESVKVRHILIRTDKNTSVETAAKSRNRIEDIRKQLLAGGDFAALAKQYSQCDSAPAGGDLGFVENGYMPPEFNQVAFSIKPGEISQIITSRFGFHILQVSDKKSAGTLPFDQVKGFISATLTKDKSRRKLEEHVSRLRHDAFIEIPDK